MCRRLFVLFVILILLLGAAAIFVMLDPLDWNLMDYVPDITDITDIIATQPPPLPTHTPNPGSEIPETQATIPVPITSSDGCEAVASAAGVVIDADTERAEAPRTLPNGQPFPGKEPRGVGVGGAIAAQARENRTEVMIQFT